MLDVPMFAGQIPIENTALIVIDMQKGFFDSTCSLGQVGMDIEPLRNAIPGTLQAVRSAREAGIPVIFTRFVYAPDMIDFPRHRRARNARRIELLSLAQEQAEVDLIEELAVMPNELVIDKSRPSSFYGTRLEPILTSLGIKNLVVCGITTSICVETTVRDAGQRDYWTFVIRDAVAEVDPGRHHYSLYNMAWSFAEVTDVSALHQSWSAN
ncbi:cysteine hydrolase family protein [Pelagibacterium mangrovi]|uniref:cysteine hydrolase family protein n=1 Tax=Pelagibacterium mangrovi TaxID=3119828 RepID=UPI002FC719FA